MQVLERYIDMENGNRAKFTAGPRYPYWTISFERGGMPAELSGMYQYYDDAVYALNTYLQNRPARNRTKLKDKETE